MSDHPAHVAANLADMDRRGKKIQEVINDFCEGRIELTEADVIELRKLVMRYAKHFTTYNW
jgi:hypothetical protein